MPKVFVYDSFENRMMTYNLNESDSMPFSTGTTLRVREFRGSSSSPTLWTTTAAMEIWVMTRLADGVLPTMGNGGAAAGMDAGGSSSPSFYLTPNTSTGTGGAGGGVHQQGLSQ